MFGKRNLEDLTIEELEQALLIKRRQARMARFARLAETGQSVSETLVGQETTSAVVKKPFFHRQAVAANLRAVAMRPLPGLKQKLFSFRQPKKRHKLMDRLLLGIEVTAVVGLVMVLVSSYFSLQTLNAEASLAQKSVVEQQRPTPTMPPPISLKVLPGGHSSPTSLDGVKPDIPPHLQQWVQPGRTMAATINVATSPQAPTRLVIPQINVDAPIVSGIGWEDLKKGVGHLPGSANPGERGNLYLAAHNDIFGEIFRRLEELKPGDEYFIYAGEQKFRYVVKQKRIIKPTEVEVMLPTTEPVATLQTCYPYLIDTQRLVVISELAK